MRRPISLKIFSITLALLLLTTLLGIGAVAIGILVAGRLLLFIVLLMVLFIVHVNMHRRGFLYDRRLRRLLLLLLATWRSLPGLGTAFGGDARGVIIRFVFGHGQSSLGAVGTGRGRIREKRVERLGSGR